MRWLAAMLVTVVGTAAPGFAQFSGWSGEPSVGPSSMQQVQHYTNMVQSCCDASDRARAVAELRNFDVDTFPQIVPILVNVLRRDKSYTVRIEAARSLGRIRPLTTAAREALTEASLRDGAFGVRWQARASLAFFTVRHINPHNYASDAGNADITTNEPPIGEMNPAFAEKSTFSKSLAPGGFGHPFETETKKSRSYALRMPQGPARPLKSAPVAKTNPPQGTLVPLVPNTEKVASPPELPLPAPDNHGQTPPVQVPVVEVGDPLPVIPIVPQTGGASEAGRGPELLSPPPE